MTKLAAILHQIDSGSVLLPEFQRGYVWNRDQVRGLMRSLYRGYPVGGLLTWETQTDGSAVRGETVNTPGVRVLILDGQQRVTSLYGVSRGRPPAFFQGDAKAFSGLRFNVEDETFEFYAPAKMRDDPRWIDVTALFTHGLAPCIAALNDHPETRPRIVSYVERLARLNAVLDHDLHEEKITGEDKTVDVVVEIFNRVNSGGTKLSKGDLALAKKCAQWPGARADMQNVYVLAKTEAGYDARYFVNMLSTYGGLGTAKRLLATTEVSSGFTVLYERGRLDLTVEALVVKPKFASLFTDQEIDIARQRLSDLGYREE